MEKSSMNFCNISPLPRLPFFMTCSSMRLSYGLLSLRSSLFLCESPQGHSCVSLHKVRSPARKPTLVWVSLFTGPQPLTGACFSTGFSHGHSLLWAQLPLLVWSSPQAAGRYLLPHGLPSAEDGQPAPPWPASSWTAGESALAHGAPPTFPSPLTLVSAKLFLQHSLSSHFQC